MMRATLDTGRVLFADGLSRCVSISSYFGTVIPVSVGTTAQLCSRLS